MIDVISHYLNSIIICIYWYAVGANNINQRNKNWVSTFCEVNFRLCLDTIVLDCFLSNLIKIFSII